MDHTSSGDTNPDPDFPLTHSNTGARPQPPRKSTGLLRTVSLPVTPRAHPGPLSPRPGPDTLSNLVRPSNQKYPSFRGTGKPLGETVTTATPGPDAPEEDPDLTSRPPPVPPSTEVSRGLDPLVLLPQLVLPFDTSTSYVLRGLPSTSVATTPPETPHAPLTVVPTPTLTESFVADLVPGVISVSATAVPRPQPRPGPETLQA